MIAISIAVQKRRVALGPQAFTAFIAMTRTYIDEMGDGLEYLNAGG
jgi:hypothetical protein